MLLTPAWSFLVLLVDAHSVGPPALFSRVSGAGIVTDACTGLVELLRQAATPALQDVDRRKQDIQRSFISMRITGSTNDSPTRTAYCLQKIMHHVQL